MSKLLLLPIVLALGACDPDLTMRTVSGTPEGGTGEGGTPPPPPPGDPGAVDGGDGGDAAITGDAGDAATGHVVDGINDFSAGEKLSTTSSATNYYAYASWDAKNVYFGMDGADVSAATSNPGSKWVMLYLGLDGVAGSTTGLAYGPGNQQQPTLPFAACYHLRWKVDGSYTNVRKWDPAASDGGGAWVNADVIGVPVPTVMRQGTFMEMSFTKASINDASKLRVHMNMLIEGTGYWTYAGVPSASFTDGQDPDFGKYFEFDLTDLVKAPNTYAPKP